MADVRMRGFAERTEVTDALAILDGMVQTLEEERVPLFSAYGRVLTTDLVSEYDMPSFDRAAMDGYAVIASDTYGASSFSPVKLTIAGEAWPARPWEGTLEPGSAVRIMTGSPIPKGADAVLMAELTEERDGVVRAAGAVEPRKHIGRRGEDVSKGDLVLRKGRRLRPQDIALAGSLGHAGLPVVRRPRVVILGTGNELIPAGAPPEPHKVVDSNSVMLAALVDRDGGETISRKIIEDDREVLRRALVESETDVVLISGGSSVGLEDHAPSLVAEMGELTVHGVAMRPSSPAGFGRIDDRLVFLLPGNPVSCLCAYEFFAGRAIRILGGRSSDWPHRRTAAPLGRKIASAVGRVDYARVELTDGGVVPIATSGASILSSTTRADGFVIVPADSEGFPAGANVEVLLYDE